MRGDSAQLPVDFLVGFTIFILSLIMVANFVPSLLVGLQRTSGIDYDAVAYRTGVVLVEDPGWPAGNPDLGVIYPTDIQPWEQLPKEDMVRLGLALSMDTPNVLSINKIKKFFCTSIFDDRFDSSTNDYRSKLLFSTYKYGYNITLQNISPMKPGELPLSVSIGQPYPAGYGYIRRYVVIRQNSNATLNVNKTVNGQLAYNAMSPDQVEEKLWIHFNGKILYNPTIDDHLKIDLQREPFTIRITNLTSVLNNSKPGFNQISPIAGNDSTWSAWGGTPDNATLAAVWFFDSTKAGSSDIPNYANRTLRIYKPDGSLDPPEEQVPATGTVNRKVYDTIELDVEPLWGRGVVRFDQNQEFYILLKFQDSPPRTLITGKFLYDYQNVTKPVLSTGMLEVGIW